MVTAIAFMALTMPLVTGVFGLVSSFSIDSRASTATMESQYSNLGADQYARYLLVHGGLADLLETGMEAVYQVILNGRQMDVTVVKLSDAPDFEPSNLNRHLAIQAGLQVAPTTADPNIATVFAYTITVLNGDSAPHNLNKIHHQLPSGFTYVPVSTQGIISSEPGVAGQQLTWDLGGLGVSLQIGESVTLTFEAEAAVDQGTYCSEAWIEPGDQNTSTGMTAGVQVGSPPENLCGGANVEVTKTVTSAGPGSVPDTYVYAYEIEIDNTGTGVLNMRHVRDRLPGAGQSGQCILSEGFCYVQGSASGDITSSEPAEAFVQGRQRLDWDFSPAFQVLPGETRTLNFQAESQVVSGEYWNEVAVTFDEFTEPVTTWPTALVTVMDVVSVSVTDGQSEVTSEVWVGTGSYVVNGWTMTR